MLRSLFLAVLMPVLFSLSLRASELIPPPSVLVSPVVTAPHMAVNLIASAPSVEPGKTVTVAFHLKMEESWHTYWINPGEAGLPTEIKWTLPTGWKAGPIQWPTPENHSLGGVVTFGYEGDAYLLVDLTAPADWKASSPLDLKAHVTWLVCQESCVPGSKDITFSLPGADAKVDLSSVDKFFSAARDRLPKPAPWTAKGEYTASTLQVTLTGKPAVSTTNDLYFYAEQPNVISANQPDLAKSVTVNGDKSILPLPLQINGDSPNTVSGVLVTNAGKENQDACYVSSFPVNPPGTATTSTDSTPSNSNPPSSSPTTSDSTPSTTVQSSVSYSYDVFVAVSAAFVGGLILNLMPCVLPVLSLKVYAIIKHSQHGGAWKQGLAYTGGVLVSFWILATVLLILRTIGDQVGWGFQLSSPGFVLGLNILFFLFALNLFGVFDVGNSLVGLDARTTGKLTGLSSAFANGALATLAATPCTGPFMGSSLGFAAQQPPYVAILIFTSLALGMASPFLLLTCYPPMMRYLPKPGAWMESFRQFLGFLLALTVVWFVQIFGSLVDRDQLGWSLTLLVMLGMGCWIYGRFIQPPTAKKIGGPVVAFACVAVASLYLGFKAMVPEETDWQPYSADAVTESLKENRPVFVDFTASWCLSCKVNEAVALTIPSTIEAFKKNNVLLLKGDWSRSDPEITKVLHQYNRDGVPMYLLFSPKNPNQPQVLPELLTPGLVQNAVNGL